MRYVLVSGQSSDKGTYETVKSAYSYVIEVSNVGLQDLETHEINITLGDDAVIVDTKVFSTSIPQDKLDDIKPDNKKNFRRITPKYINRNDSITISILSVNDTTPNCEIKIGGIGIILQERSAALQRESNLRSRFSILANLFALGVALATIIIVLLWNNP